VNDIEAIKQLKARYFRTLDTKDWSGLRDVFTDDVEIDTTDIGGSPIKGADDFIAFLQEVLAEAQTVHLGHTPEITITSPTAATGIWTLHDLFIVDGTRMASYGHLYDTYAKRSDGWRIARSVVTRMHLETSTTELPQ
jgi:uncharacterized protein (TIGR02246 family)